MAFLPQKGGGLFTIDPNASPEQIARKRELLAAMMPQFGNARYVGQGIGQLATGIAMGRQNRQLDKIENTNRDKISGMFDSLFSGGGSGSAPIAPQTGGPITSAPIDPNTPQHIANDAMRAIGKTPALPNRDEVANYIVQKAGELGIDPQVALAVARSEGLNANPAEAWQSNVVKNGQRETSYGPFQLYTGGGLGNQFMEQTGLDPRDPNTWQQQVDFALGHARNNGWGAWYGAKNTGIGNMQGIPGGGQGGGASPRVAQAGGSMDIKTLAEIAASPYASAGQKAVAQALLQQQMQGMDPNYSLDLEKKRLEIDKLRNPQKYAGGADRPEYGLTPQFVTDANGELRMLQLGKDGSSKLVDIPEGMAIQKGVEKLDLGTHYQWYNTITGEAMGQPIPKNTREAEAEKAIGKAEGENAVEAASVMPGVVAKAEQSLALIDSIVKDPALAGITGMFQGRMPPFTQAGTDLNVKIENLKGKVFLEAFESLKGGGQITEREGAAAQAAMARLDRAQSTDEYISALNELAGIIRAGADRAKAKAGQPQDDDVPTYNPQTGKWE